METYKTVLEVLHTRLTEGRDQDRDPKEWVLFVELRECQPEGRVGLLYGRIMGILNNIPGREKSFWKVQWQEVDLVVTRLAEILFLAVGDQCCLPLVEPESLGEFCWQPKEDSFAKWRECIDKQAVAEQATMAQQLYTLLPHRGAGLATSMPSQDEHEMVKVKHLTYEKTRTLIFKKVVDWWTVTTNPIEAIDAMSFLQGAVKDDSYKELVVKALRESRLIVSQTRLQEGIRQLTFNQRDNPLDEMAEVLLHRLVKTMGNDHAYALASVGECFDKAAHLDVGRFVLDYVDLILRLQEVALSFIHHFVGYYHFAGDWRIDRILPSKSRITVYLIIEHELSFYQQKLEEKIASWPRMAGPTLIVELRKLNPRNKDEQVVAYRNTIKGL